MGYAEMSGKVKPNFTWRDVMQGAVLISLFFLFLLYETSSYYLFIGSDNAVIYSLYSDMVLGTHYIVYVCYGHMLNVLNYNDLTSAMVAYGLGGWNGVYLFIAVFLYALPFVCYMINLGKFVVGGAVVLSRTVPILIIVLGVGSYLYLYTECPGYLRRYGYALYELRPVHSNLFTAVGVAFFVLIWSVPIFRKWRA